MKQLNNSDVLVAAFALKQCPSRDEKQALADASGNTYKQVKVWFGNSRRQLTDEQRAAEEEQKELARAEKERVRAKELEQKKEQKRTATEQKKEQKRTAAELQKELARAKELEQKKEQKRTAAELQPEKKKQKRAAAELQPAEQVPSEHRHATGNFTKEQWADTAPPSKAALQRMENIARNQEMLNQLGLA